MSSPTPEPHSHSPRADLTDGLGWVALGVAVLAGSLVMDRLESQHINPVTVPGLLPGLLGIAMVLLGLVLALRSVGRGALQSAPVKTAPAALADLKEQRLRLWVVIALCVLYGVVLVGHGLPFWLASAVYVTGSVLMLERIGRTPVRAGLTAGAWLQALAVGLGAAVITHLVFQEIFLVRLP